MKTPSEFDDIRPYEAEELAEVYARLLANPQFQKVMQVLYPGVPTEMVGQKMSQCKTNLDFQKEFAYPFLKDLIAKASTGCDMDASKIDNSKRYTFISN